MDGRSYTEAILVFFCFVFVFVFFLFCILLNLIRKTFNIFAFRRVVSIHLILHNSGVNRDSAIDLELELLIMHVLEIQND